MKKFAVLVGAAHAKWVYYENPHQDAAQGYPPSYPNYYYDGGTGDPAYEQQRQQAWMLYYQQTQQANPYWNVPDVTTPVKQTGAYPNLSPPGQLPPPLPKVSSYGQTITLRKRTSHPANLRKSNRKISRKTNSRKTKSRLRSQGPDQKFAKPPVAYWHQPFRFPQDPAPGPYESSEYNQDHGNPQQKYKRPDDGVPLPRKITGSYVGSTFDDDDDSDEDFNYGDANAAYGFPGNGAALLRRAGQDNTFGQHVSNDVDDDAAFGGDGFYRQVFPEEMSVQARQERLRRELHDMDRVVFGSKPKIGLLKYNF